MYRIFHSLLFNYKRHINSFIVLIFILFTSFSLFAQSTGEYKLRTVVIDPGHGGKDPGAVYKSGKKLLGKEKDIVLSVALTLGDYIKKNYPDVTVIFTRDKDEFIELYRRAQIANKNKADLFISIHVNASKKKEPNGAETYTMGIHKTQGNLDVAMAENSVILKEKNYSIEYEGFDVRSPEAYIIFSMMQNSYLEQSLNFASKVQKQYKETLKREDKGIKQAGFLVLWKTAMPCVLTEIGFISNFEEMKYLMNKTGQHQIAYALFSAFREYKNEREGIKDDGIKIEKPEFIADNAFTSETNDSITVVMPYDTLHIKSNGTSDLKKNESQEKNQSDSLENKKNQKKETNINFKIQITSSVTKIPLNSGLFKGLHVEEIEIDGSYKYTVCNTNSYKEIENLQKLIRNDFPDSFIVAFLNGKKIPVSDAKKEIKN